MLHPAMCICFRGRTSLPIHATPPPLTSSQSPPRHRPPSSASPQLIESMSRCAYQLPCRPPAPDSLHDVEPAKDGLLPMASDGRRHRHEIFLRAWAYEGCISRQHTRCQLLARCTRIQHVHYHSVNNLGDGYVISIHPGDISHIRYVLENNKYKKNEYVGRDIFACFLDRPSPHNITSSGFLLLATLAPDNAHSRTKHTAMQARGTYA